MLLPHPIPYQGSKRRLAPVILEFFPRRIQTLYEPFAGSAAITLAAAAKGAASAYVLGDSLRSLASLWQAITASPMAVADKYQGLWEAQLEDPRAFYKTARDEFNRSRDPVYLLYLLARCVKNAVRFNSEGNFNQGADHRRLGMRPAKMRTAVLGASDLLRGKSTVFGGDFRVLLARATDNDLVYMDPPYQGVSRTRDPRYAQQLNREVLVQALSELNAARVPYIVSFDGTCGEREYGAPLPDHLELSRIDIDAGRSSQATLNGQSARTVESLYLSRAIPQRR